MFDTEDIGIYFAYNKASTQFRALVNIFLALQTVLSEGDIMFTIDIDTGGTMTDALVSDGELMHSFKVDTTPHDYTVSFLDCLAEASKKFNYDDVKSFLAHVLLIRWSSTITTNVLGERRGSKIGLLVSKGHETDLYGDGYSLVVGELIADDRIIGLSDDPNPEEIMSAVRELLESGVRRICVSLKGAFPDNSNEVAIKKVIEDQYPDHIIGSIPVLLGSEMAQLAHDQTRTHYSLMNAYTHNQLAMSLFKAEDLLREEYGWNGPLLIGHTSGGVSRISKTKAVDTIESGPVFGTFGSAFVARSYGLRNVVCFDVGGTTTKVSIVKDGQPLFQRGGELMGIPVKTSFAMLRSAVVGGGSIVSVKDDCVVLGPESMGAVPGPACYGLGGTNATLTDALLHLGYLDPDNFLGGRRKLDVELSRKAIESNVAVPLGMNLDMAALAIRNEAVDMMAELISDTMQEANIKSDDTDLFAFGGNGPMFSLLVAETLGIESTYIFNLGPVFSAFGSAISDVVHVYERGVGVVWKPEVSNIVADVMEGLRQQAVRDLDAEGFPTDKAEYTFEFEFGIGDQVTGKISLDNSIFNTDQWFEHADSIVHEAGIKVQKDLLQLVRLSSRYQIEEHSLVKQKQPIEKIPTGLRSVSFNGLGFQDIAIHQWEGLAPGDQVAGPTVINGATQTCPIPNGWTMKIDEYGNACIRQVVA